MGQDDKNLGQRLKDFLHKALPQPAYSLHNHDYTSHGFELLERNWYEHEHKHKDEVGDS